MLIGAFLYDLIRKSLSWPTSTTTAEAEAAFLYAKYSALVFAVREEMDDEECQETRDRADTHFVTIVEDIDTQTLARGQDAVEQRHTHALKRSGDPTDPHAEGDTGHDD